MALEGQPVALTEAVEVTNGAAENLESEEFGYCTEFILKLNEYTSDNEVEVYIGEKIVSCESRYDVETHTFVVSVDNWDYSDDIIVVLKNKHNIMKNAYEKKIFNILNNAEISYSQKEDIYRPIRGGRDLNYIISELSGRNIDLEIRDAVLEQLLAMI